MENINLKNVQELKNEKDAYYMDRKGNIGIIEFVGDCEGNHGGERSRLYKMNGELEYIVSYKKFKDIDFFCDGDEYRRIDNDLFSELGDDNHNFSHIFIPNKEKLLWLVELSKDLGIKVYCVTNELYTYVIKLELYEKRESIKSFNEKEEAIIYYNELKEKIFEKLNEYLKIASDKLAEVNDKLKTEGIDASEDLSGIMIKNAECGIKYHFMNLYGGFSKRTIVVDYIDKDGVAHLTNGKVLSPNSIVASVEIYQKRELREKYGWLISFKNDINKFIQDVNLILLDKDSFKPFSKNKTYINIENFNERIERIKAYIIP